MSEEFKNGGLPGMAGIITAMTGVQPAMVSLGEGAVAAAFSMDQLKNALLGDETLDEIIAGKRCSKNVGCGKNLVKEDGSPVYMFDTREEAETYEMEYRRTGLCPSCLNRALTALDDSEDECGHGDNPDPTCDGCYG